MTTQQQQPEAKVTVPVTVTLQVPVQRLADLLCSALEGGSNYWIDTFTVVAPPGGYAFRMDAASGERAEPETFPHIDAPFNAGGALRISVLEDDGEQERVLDRAALEKGIGVLAAKYPHHFTAVLDESDDADTGDAFLQCCLFGEIVYG